MRLIARRAGYWCNGIPYDSTNIAGKALRLAAGPVLREAEEISAHQGTHGRVRLAHAPDYGYTLEIVDARHDTEEVWVSDSHDEMIESCLVWVRAFR